MLYSSSHLNCAILLEICWDPVDSRGECLGNTESAFEAVWLYIGRLHLACHLILLCVFYQEEVCSLSTRPHEVRSVLGS